MCGFGGPNMDVSDGHLNCSWPSRRRRMGWRNDFVATRDTGIAETGLRVEWFVDGDADVLSDALGMRTIALRFNHAHAWTALYRDVV